MTPKKTKKSAPAKVRKADPVVDVKPFDVREVPVDRKEKKAVAPKAPKAPKAAKEPKEPKTPREDLMVFAFRLTKEESAIIHKAAGPGKASKFARTLLVAAARSDEAAVREIMMGSASAA